MASGSTLEPADIATLVIYFVVVLFVGLWATIRADRGNTAGFFLAGKSMTFLPVAGSIWATNMGSTMFVGLAGTAARNGFAPVMFEWHATYMLVLLGWVFVPIYVATGCYTMSEYLSRRYGGKRLRVYYSAIQLFLVVISGISGELYAGSLFIQQVLGFQNIYLPVVVILIATGIYTIGGGLTAVIWTDALQAVILVIGSSVVAAIATIRMGGYEGVVNQFPVSAANTSYLTQATYGNLSCAFPPEDAFHIFLGIDSGYPWPGLIFGLTILACYYFCSNQTIVQRNLSAKNVLHSKGGCVIASYLKILPFFLFVIPGMVARILYPDEVACADPDKCEKICGNRNGCTNIAYPLLVLRILPAGVRGLMLAALLSALMSSLTSIYNSGSTMFTLDIWKYFRPRAGEREMVIVGRLVGLLLIGLSVVWLPILQAIQGSQLWDYLQAISSYINPPWVAVYLLGIFWPRATEKGALAGLLVGLVVGVSRMAIHFSYAGQPCGSSQPDNRPPILARVHYLHFAIILFTITIFVTVLVSLVTEPREQKKLNRVTWKTRKSEKEPEWTDSEGEEEEEAGNEEEETEVQVSLGRKIYNFACGFSTKPAKRPTKAEKLSQMDIKEDPFWSKVCDINAVIAVALTCFIIGFYA